MRTQHQIFEAIQRERTYQDAKWGTIDEHSHSVGEYLLILKAELDEAVMAWCKGNGDSGALEEILQVASVAFACMEHHGIVERHSFVWERMTADEAHHALTGEERCCCQKTLREHAK